MREIGAGKMKCLNNPLWLPLMKEEKYTMYTHLYNIQDPHDAYTHRYIFNYVHVHIHTQTHISITHPKNEQIILTLAPINTFHYPKKLS